MNTNIGEKEMHNNYWVYGTHQHSGSQIHGFGSYPTLEEAEENFPRFNPSDEIEQIVLSHISSDGKETILKTK